MSLHPANLIDSMGRSLPAALIPICSYQGESAVLGQTVDGFNFTACGKFQPTVMEGQLCYSLDVNNVTRAKSKAGRAMGLRLLLDRIHPRKLENEDEDSFRIFLNTLDGFSDMEDGGYRMINVKEIVGTDSFMELSDEDKKCQKETYQDCHTRQFLEQLKQACSCIPWGFNHVLQVE